MYTVIVADYDDEFRKRIIEKIEWKSIGFQVIGAAKDGEEAFELIKELEPDFLLTEIDLPKLNGIELTRQLRKVRPSIQIAFLSSHEEFAYAQQAIQYNIVDYILKPISLDELGGRLESIKEKIDGYFGAFTHKYAKERKISSQEFVLSLLLSDFVQGEQQETRIIEAAIQCGFLRDANNENLRYVVVVTEIQDEYEKNAADRRSVDAVENILKKYVKCISCYLNGRVISVTAATQAGLNKYLPVFAEEMIENSARISMGCRIGISSQMSSILKCREAYMEAMIAFEAPEKNSVVFLKKQEKDTVFNQGEFQKSIDKIEMLLYSGSSRGLGDYFQKLEEKILSGKQEVGHCLFILWRIVAMVYNVVYHVSGETGVCRLQKEYPLHNMQNMDNVMKGLWNVKDLCLSAQKMLNIQKKKSSELICEKVLNSITNRYMEQELSVMMISEEIGISPNYLSALVKRTTGKTFVELLTEKRIKRAEELLLHTVMKIREIAEECGYRDQYYFSHCFKKATGISPNSYRQKKSKNESNE